LRRPVNPLWGLLEIAALAALFFFGLWSIGPRLASDPAAVALYWIFVVIGGVAVMWLSPVVLHCDPAALRGWGRRRADGADPGSFRNAWRAYGVFTLVAALLLILIALARDPALVAGINWTALGIKFLGYLAFGVVQAFIFFGFVQTRVRTMVRLPPTPGSVARHRLQVSLVTAAIFAAFHLPNPPLIAVVFATGFCWAWIFYRRPNVLLLGFSHAVLGTLLHRVVQMYMRIGPFYSEPDLYVFRSVIPGLKQLIGNQF
jgi:membrane protease YdiL (CAAX protease family)